MCINPITITRNYPLIGTKTFVVPCGKCAECVKKKQAEFSALSIHQGLQSGSVHFFTFTYRNETCPVALSEETPEGVPNIIGFERGVSDWLTNGVFTNRVLFDKFNFDTDVESYRCPSLHREDVKLVIKRFRSNWKKDHPDEPLNMKYAVFGEFGEKHGRPHYHGLFFGLSDAQAKYLQAEWSNAFGFCHCPSIEGHSGTSLEDVIKLSTYVSKYISKGTYTRWNDILPYVEKPRRQSSLNFGSFSQAEIDRLYSFIMGATYCLEWMDFSCLILLSWILYRLDAQVLPLLDANSLSQFV